MGTGDQRVDVADVCYFNPADTIAASVSLSVLAATAHESQRLQYMTQRMTEVALLVGCYVSIVVFAVAAPILGLLGGAEYEAAASVLRIQVFALIPSFLAQVWLTALIAIGLVLRRGAWGGADRRRRSPRWRNRCARRRDSPRHHAARDALSLAARAQAQT
ncbi:MAG: hypothetical protein ACRDKY_08025, partial [Solirubrobacteraceae bacterium]